MFQKWNSGMYLNQGWLVGWLIDWLVGLLVSLLVTIHYENHSHGGKM